ncbi:MAG TPA: YncE family protein [Terriglobia bacterium]|nr:YncE family protein [Terriglobia bacterium]
MKLLPTLFYFALTVLAASASPLGNYRILKEIPLGGRGRGDYLTLDGAARHLYVSHESEIVVVNADSYALIGKIPAQGAHGIALAEKWNHGFSTNGEANTVTMFDLKNLKALRHIPAGKGPDGIIYDPATHRVFAFNGDGDSATAIDAETGKVAGTVDLGGGPEFAAADGHGYVFNNLEDKSELVRIDARKLKVDARWPLAPCQRPSSMAMDQANRRLFIGCRSHVMSVVNADNGHVITTLPIGDHVDATSFDPETHTIFNSNGDGTVNVFRQDDPDHYTHVATIKTLPFAKTHALDLKSRRLFLSTEIRGKFTLLVVGQ